jgi:Ca-activated chloride channel family protein
MQYLTPWLKILMFFVMTSVITVAIATEPVIERHVQLALGLGQNTLLAGKTERLFIKVGLKSTHIVETKARAPINVALVIDRSGSMSGDKIDNAREAAINSLDYLNSTDTVALVIYDDEVEVPFPAAPLKDKGAVRQVIRNIETRGSTALFAGVEKAAEEIKKFATREKINRIVLISDGQANVGPSTPEELAELGRTLGGQRISVSTIGLGLDYNEDLMFRLAGASDGNHAFVEEPEELAKTFRKEFGELGSVIAQDITVVVHCETGVRPIRILGRVGKVFDDRIEVSINQLYADQERYLMLEVEVAPGTAGTERNVARVDLSYDDVSTKSRATASDNVKVTYTKSSQDAEQSVNREVMIDASAQIGAEMYDKALELKDKGQTEQARAVFQGKAQFLNQQATKFNSDALRQQGASSAKEADAVVAPTKDWYKSRKNSRAIQYGIQNQQAW